MVDLLRGEGAVAQRYAADGYVTRSVCIDLTAFIGFAVAVVVSAVTLLARSASDGDTLFAGGGTLPGADAAARDWGTADAILDVVIVESIIGKAVLTVVVLAIAELWAEVVVNCVIAVIVAAEV